MYGLQEGLILTENENDIIEIEGHKISVIPIWKWLLFLPSNSMNVKV